MDPKKIIMDLNYRIESAKDDDPEKENAIRLRDRLLAKYGLSLSDLVEVREEREFGSLTDSESSFVGQYFRRKTKELAKKLREEHERQMKALEYAIYDKAGILFPAGYGNGGDDGSSYGLKEAMRAASELSDTIFPDLQIEQQFKAIAGGI